MKINTKGLRKGSTGTIKFYPNRIQGSNNIMKVWQIVLVILILTIIFVGLLLLIESTGATI